jgi:uncharacterized iron-regulated membrane protein
MPGHDTAAGAAPTVSDVHSAGEAASIPSDLPDGQSGGMNGMGGMVMVCVAMLAGAAVALLAVLARRARLPRVWAILAPAGRVRVAVPAVLRVGAGPPTVWRFSVIRC